MQVEVHDVDAEVARPGDPEDGVEVGAVVVDQTARLVDGRDDLLDVLVPQPEGVGVGDHQPGGVRSHRRAQRVEIAVAARVGGDRDDLEPGHHRGGGVGAVGAVGDQDLGAPGVAAGEVPGADDEAAGQLALRAGDRLQRDLVETGDLAQHLLQLAHQLQGALDGAGVLVGVDVGEPRQAGHDLVDLRVVLHRARPQGVHADVDGVVLLGEAGVVTDDVDLADLGPVEALADHPLRQGRLRHVRFGKAHAAPPRLAQFKDQRLDRHGDRFLWNDGLILPARSLKTWRW